MLVAFPKSKTLHKGDTIALTKNGTFIGYGEVLELLEEIMLIKLDQKSTKMFNEIFGEDVPFDFEIS